MRAEAGKMPESTISAIGNAPASLMTDLGQTASDVCRPGRRDALAEDCDGGKPGMDPCRRFSAGLPLSKHRRKRFASIPPPYPVRLWSLPMTRWQGAKMEIAFAPLALATARTAVGLPMRRAISP